MADYLDTVLALNPTTFHRLQDSPVDAGTLVDSKSVQNMTFAATDDHTQSPFDIAAYPTPPNILEGQPTRSGTVAAPTGPAARSCGSS
jgi:hypothetical protein